MNQFNKKSQRINQLRKWPKPLSVGRTRVEVRVEQTAAGAKAEATVPAMSMHRVDLSYGGSSSERRLILEKITLDVHKAEFLCIVGPSGSGKTTLLRMFAGLVKPTAGEVRFRSQVVSGPSRERAIIFQDYSKALLPWRTVAGNIALSLEAEGIRPADQRPIIAALLAKMGIERAADQYPGQLSGGMQQRVQIARCLAQRPKILLMDEPFGALDAMTRQALQDEILVLSNEQRMTVVFITHDLEEAIYLGDRVVVLGDTPARIVETIDVDLPHPRDQLTTREDPRFLAHRHRLFGLLRRN
jgi:NitT/TauT family transport system ATP-binding protein